MIQTLAARIQLAKMRAEDGQALVEYALILFLVALVCVGSLSAIGVSVSAAINAMAAGL